MTWWDTSKLGVAAWGAEMAKHLRIASLWMSTPRFFNFFSLLTPPPSNLDTVPAGAA